MFQVSPPGFVSIKLRRWIPSLSSVFTRFCPHMMCSFGQCVWSMDHSVKQDLACHRIGHGPWISYRGSFFCRSLVHMAQILMVCGPKFFRNAPILEHHNIKPIWNSWLPKFSAKIFLVSPSLATWRPAWQTNSAWFVTTDIFFQQLHHSVSLLYLLKHNFLTSSFIFTKTRWHLALYCWNSPESRSSWILVTHTMTPSTFFIGVTAELLLLVLNTLVKLKIKPHCFLRFCSSQTL